MINFQRVNVTSYLFVTLKISMRTNQGLTGLGVFSFSPEDSEVPLLALRALFLSLFLNLDIAESPRLNVLVSSLIWQKM